MFCSRNGRCRKLANRIDKIGREGEHFVVSAVRDACSALGGHIIGIVPMSPDDQMTRIAASRVVARVHDDPVRSPNFYRPILDRIRHTMSCYDLAGQLEPAVPCRCGADPRPTLFWPSLSDHTREARQIAARQFREFFDQNRHWIGGTVGKLSTKLVQICHFCQPKYGGPGGI